MAHDPKELELFLKILQGEIRQQMGPASIKPVVESEDEERVAKKQWRDRLSQRRPSTPRD